jgi:hypothetical protein
LPVGVRARAAQLLKIKSFLVLFFKNEHLPSLPIIHPPPYRRHDLASPKPRRLPLLVVSGADAGAKQRDRQMTRYYRAALTALLIGGLAVPAFAQTPAPAAPQPAAEAPAAPEASAPAADTTPKPATPSKHAVKKHHRTTTKHKAATAAKDTDSPPAAQQK